MRLSEPRRGALPPNGGIYALELLDRLRVDAGGEVLPTVVRSDADHVALVELGGDAHGDRRDRAGGYAGEEPLLPEQALGPDDRVAVRDHDLAVEQRQVDDRRNETVVERPQPLDELALHRLGGDDLGLRVVLLLP